VIKKVIKGEQLASLAAKLADSRKAEGITLVDLRGHSDMTDWFLICEGDNVAHNRAIADAIVEGLRAMKTTAWHMEGLMEGRWIVLDFSDVVVHIMLPAVRQYYDLDALWPNGAKKKIEGERDDGQ
jgi:ribosome-associated protein